MVEQGKEIEKQILEVDTELNKKLYKQLANAHVLSGSCDSGEEKSIGWIDSYFGKYTLDGLDNILNLRLKDLNLKDVKTLKGTFIDQNHNNIANTIIQVSGFTEKITLVPINLFNKHAAGLIFEKTNNSLIRVKYLDPLNNPMPIELKQLIIESSSSKIFIQEILVEQQKYANCGSETAENLIGYTLGLPRAISQEKAIELHSQLVENSLLGINSTGIHLLFEKLANKYQHIQDYPEQSMVPSLWAYNKLFHNLFYGK